MWQKAKIKEKTIKGILINIIPENIKRTDGIIESM